MTHCHSAEALIYGRIFVLLIPDLATGAAPTCIDAVRVHPRVPARVAAAAAVRGHHGAGAPEFVGVIADGDRHAALFAVRVPA